MRDRVFPIPEIFQEEQGQNWKIRHKPKAGVNYETRTIYAPLDNDPVSHNLKLREIARIKWDDTSVSFDELDNSIANSLQISLENHRLNYLLNRAGINTHSGFLNEKEFEGVFESLSNPLSFHPVLFLSALLETDHTALQMDEKCLEEHKNDDQVSLFIEVRKRILENPTKLNVKNIFNWLRSILLNKL